MRSGFKSLCAKRRLSPPGSSGRSGQLRVHFHPSATQSVSVLGLPQSFMNASNSSMRSIHSSSFCFLALLSRTTALGFRFRISAFIAFCSALVVGTVFVPPNHVFTVFRVTSYTGSGAFFFLPNITPYLNLVRASRYTHKHRIGYSHHYQSASRMFYTLPVLLSVLYFLL